MIWHIIRYWLTFLIPTFYKRIQGNNIKNLTTKGPVIIAMNHPNAFTDPILITYLSYPLRVKYMARGDAFKPGAVSSLLEWIGIVPIYRMRDGGKEGLKKNDESYRRVNELLSKNAKIIVFAEGLCVQERRLRPLKKGVARMVFGAYEHLNTNDLKVVPVGINYSKAHKFRSTVFYNVGEPIYIKDFIEEYKQNTARAHNSFLQVLEPKMRELITHISDPKNDQVVDYIEELCKKDWLKNQCLNHKNLNDDLTVLKQIVELVNNTAINNQNALDEFKTLAQNYFKKLESYKLRDWLINPNQNKHISYSTIGFRIMLLTIGLPVHLLGIIGNFLPLLLTHRIAKKTIKNKEFYSSIALGVGMFVFLINYVLLFLICYLNAETIILPSIYCIVFMLAGWFSLYYHPFAVKSLGILRILRNKPLLRELSVEREKLLSLINKF